MPLDIRKLVVHLEEARAEGGRGDDGGPLRKVAALAVIANPYAGRPWSDALDELVKRAGGPGPPPWPSGSSRRAAWPPSWLGPPWPSSAPRSRATARPPWPGWPASRS